jgi:hypothetical protein
MAGRTSRPLHGARRMLELAHAHTECTGNWRLIGSSDRRMIGCDGCNAVHDATPDNRLAAIDENYAGIYLRRLAAEGAAHLSSDSD